MFPAIFFGVGREGGGKFEAKPPLFFGWGSLIIDDEVSPRRFGPPDDFRGTDGCSRWRALRISCRERRSARQGLNRCFCLSTEAYLLDDLCFCDVYFK